MWDLQNEDVLEAKKNKAYKTIAKELDFRDVEEMISYTKDSKLVKAINLLCQFYEVPNILEQKNKYF